MKSLMLKIFSRVTKHLPNLSVKRAYWHNLDMNKSVDYGLWLVLGLVAHLVALGWLFASMLLPSSLTGFLGLTGLGPYFIIPVLLGITIGAIVKMRARWTVIVLPLALFISEARTLSHNAASWSSTPYKEFVDNFIADRCQASECLYEIGMTAPLIIAIAFYIANVISHSLRAGEPT